MSKRTYTNPHRVYFDMDGVLADYEKAARDANHSIFTFKNCPGVYRYFPVYPGAKEAVQAIISKGYEVFVLTKIPKGNATAASDKILWLNEFFPEIGENIIISPDKGALGKPGHYLIDDHPEWANANNFNGTVLKFVGDWSILDHIPDINSENNVSSEQKTRPSKKKDSVSSGDSVEHEKAPLTLKKSFRQKSNMLK